MIDMMTSSNGNIFRVTGPLCGEFTGPGEFPTQRPVTRSFDVFFDLRLNKRLSKQPWGWWFETPSCSLWRQCNDYFYFDNNSTVYKVNALYRSTASTCDLKSYISKVVNYKTHVACRCIVRISWPEWITPFDLNTRVPFVVNGNVCSGR